MERLAARSKLVQCLPHAVHMPADNVARRGSVQLANTSRRNTVPVTMIAKPARCQRKVSHHWGCLPGTPRQGAVVEVGLPALVLPPATNCAATTLGREVDGIAATVSAAGLSDDPPTFRSHGCQRSTARPAQTSRGYGTGCDSCLDLIISRADMLSSMQRSRDTGMLNRLAMRFDLVISASLCNGALLDPVPSSKLSSKSHQL